MLFLAFTDICLPPHPQTVGDRVLTLPDDRCYNCPLTANRVEEVGVDASYEDPVPGKIHNQMREDCPRLGIRALVKATETTGFRYKYFPQKVKIIPWDAEAALL